MFSSSLRRVVVSTVLLLALIVALLLAVPSVRASIDAFFGLRASPSEDKIQPTGTMEISISVPPTRLMVTQPAPTRGVLTAQPTGSVDLSTDPKIQQVAGMAGWTVLTSAFLPEGYHFECLLPLGKSADLFELLSHAPASWQ